MAAAPESVIVAGNNEESSARRMPAPALTGREISAA